MENLCQMLRVALPGLDALENEPMSRHCSFRIGGAAAAFCRVSDEAQLAALLALLRREGVPYVVIGRGSNLLVSDGGFPGAVVQLADAPASLRREGDCVSAWAGVTLARLAVFAREQGLAGLEFAHGIPGSLGGGILMNAGAYGGEMKDVVVSVRYLDAAGAVRETAEPGFAYRHSRFSDSGEIVLGAALRLRPDAPDAIAARMAELWEKRSASQPLSLPSAGSTFKRPATGYAAAMIDGAGCKGLAVGGAQVSEKHAGFVVNRGGATAADVKALMAQVQRRVLEKYGVELQPEVRFLGF